MILIVDDNEVILKLLEKILRARGYKTMKAVNGREALDHIIKFGNTIQLMLLDLMMPELTGIDLLEILQNKEIKIPTIVLTGYIHELKDAVQHQPLAVLTKPFNCDELIHEIEQGLKCQTT